MRTEELSIFGYCCTGSVIRARHPTRRMTRLTTIASTGCLMKASVKERIVSPELLRPADGRGPGRAARHGHEDAVVELEGSGRGHFLAGGEPLEHDDLVAEDGSAPHVPELRPELALRVRGDDVDVIPARTLPEGVHRDGERSDRRPDGHLD